MSRREHGFHAACWVVAAWWWVTVTYGIAVLLGDA